MHGPVHYCVRAGQATTLPRQRDHVFRPQIVCYCIMSLFVVATLCRQRNLNIFRIFSCPWSSCPLFRCRVVVVVNLNNCRVPSSELFVTKRFPSPISPFPFPEYRRKCWQFLWGVKQLIGVNLRLIENIYNSIQYTICQKWEYNTTVVFSLFLNWAIVARFVRVALQFERILNIWLNHINIFKYNRLFCP